MKSGTQLTLGDLHGNAALLLFHLVKWGKANLIQTHFTPRYIEEDTSSLSNLKILLYEGVISQDEVQDLIESAYKPALKIITLAK